MLIAVLWWSYGKKIIRTIGRLLSARANCWTNCQNEGYLRFCWVHMTSLWCILSVFLGCGRTWYARMGVIVSPNYPHYYDDNSNCVYIIDVYEENRVTLRLDDFYLESGSDCQYDYLKVLQCLKSFNGLNIILHYGPTRVWHPIELSLHRLS